MRSLLAWRNRLDGSATVTPTIDSFSGSAIAGWEPSKILDPRLRYAWQVPSGGPHFVTIDLGASVSIGLVALLAPPPPFDLLGTPTVRLRATAGGADLYVGNVSFRPPAGLPDRRWFVPPAPVAARFVRVELASGSYLGSIWAGAAYDLNQYMEPVRGIAVNEGAAVVKPDGREIYYPAADAASPRRWLTMSATFNGVPSSTLWPSGTMGGLIELWDRVGRVGPLCFVPHAEEVTTNTAGVELAHATGIWGRIANELEFKPQGTGRILNHLGTAVTEPLWGFTAQFEGFL